MWRNSQAGVSVLAAAAVNVSTSVISNADSSEVRSRDNKNKPGFSPDSSSVQKHQS